MRKALPTVLFFGLAACGQGHDGAAAISHTSYKLGGASVAGLTRKVAQDAITICLSDPTNSAQHYNDVEASVLKWVGGLRDVVDKPLATKVDIVAVGQPCDGSVYIGNYQPAYTQIGSHPAVHLNYDGWYGSSTVTLHEFGHAFGLLDTYVARGGACEPGQPNSVMCWASYDELQPDDVDGVRHVYDTVTSKVADDGTGPKEGTIVY